MTISYVVNPRGTVIGPRNSTLDLGGVHRAVLRARTLATKIASEEIDIPAILGMRNLSAFIGELFAASLIHESSSRLKKNPHQDGYPDLLLMDDEGVMLWERLNGRLREKGPFSPFETGGFEVKATCGSVPHPAWFAKRGQEKPDIGDERINVVRGYDWKAHHRETNNLFGIFWDFVDATPTIVAVFYSNVLDESDWGRIVQPREGGGRTTSVSIMTRAGVKKMYDGWLLAIADKRYKDFFNRYNASNLIG